MTHFLHDSEFSEVEMTATPLDFRNAVAKLSASPILGPLAGGVPLIAYLAGRGLEDDFKELAEEISEDGQRIMDLPNREQPIVVAFGSADALEDQALNPPPSLAGVALAPAEPSAAPLSLQPEPQPAAAAEPAMPPTPEPEPVAAVALQAATPEPVAAAQVPPAPGSAASEADLETATAAPAPAAEETPAAAPAPEAPAPATQQTESDGAVAPAAASAPELEPLPIPEPERLPGPEPQPQPVVEEVTVVPSAPVEAPVVLAPPVALALGSDYYALCQAITSGTQAIVWQARRLAGPPEPDTFEIWQPGAAAYNTLVESARAGRRYPDAGRGEWAAIRLALRGAEQNLSEIHALLLALGSRGLRLFYPNPAVAGAVWPDDFPCYVTEWVEGVSVTDSPAFSEPTGLDLAGQILELAQAAREAAPQALLTDGLRPGRILVSYDARGAALARITDWTVAPVEAAGGLAGLAERLGETLADLFADIRPETYRDLTALGLGRPGDPALGSWDTLTTGTRTLIRRTLRGEFEGGIDEVLAELKRLLSEQRSRWADNDPMWQARLVDSNAEKLNWLDIASVKLGNLSGEARARLNQSRVDETIDLVTNYSLDGKYYDAVFDLRVANRRFPEVSFFRWALLANTVATLSPEGAYKRLRLDEALTLMSIDEFASARQALDHGIAFFDEVQFAPEHREQARDYVSALGMAAQSLSLAVQAQADLQENWNVEQAEASLSLAEDRVGRYERLAGDLLHGRDALCLEKIAALKASIADFYARHGRYDPYAARRETTEQARRGSFARLIERAVRLAATDKPADWSAGGLLYDRAAAEFPDLWKEDHDRDRTALAGKVGTRRLAEARQALSAGNWSAAASSLSAAMLVPASHDEASRLLSGLWLYQRGELELQRSDASAALASFAAAAETGPELRTAAETAAERAKARGGAAGGDAVSRELSRRFSEQQTAIQTAVQAAALAAQQQAASGQLSALKQTQSELVTGVTAAVQKTQAEQEERLKAHLDHMQRDLRDDQAAVIKRAEEAQSAQIQKLVVQVTDEAAENQKQALAQFRKDTADSLRELQATAPDWFTKSQQAARKAQDDQDKKLAAVVKTIEDTSTWLRESAAKAPEPEKAAPVETATDQTVKDLTWKVEGVTTTLNGLRGRVGLLVGLNVLLLAALLAAAACGGAYWLLPGLRSRLPGLPAAATAVQAAQGATPSAAAATPAPSTGAASVPATSAAQAPTAAGTLVCANADQAASYYLCDLTNLTDRPRQFVLTITPDQVNGFFYSVLVDGRPASPAAGDDDLGPGASRFGIGIVGKNEKRQVRINLACTLGGGCKTTQFSFKVSTDDAAELKNGEVTVTTAYTAP